MSDGDLICDGPITKQHLETILQDHFRTSHKITKAKGEVVSKGLGFTADIMRVDLEWDTEDGLPLRVIAKAPKIENHAVLMEQFSGKKKTDESTQFVPMIHERECVAYRLLNPNPPLPVPLIYGSWLVTDKRPGLIVMEDLGARAGIVENLANGLTLDQWLNIVLHLADLHAWSLKSDTWQSQVPDVTSLKEAFNAFNHNAMTAKLKEIKEKYPEYFAQIDEEKLIREVQYDKYETLHTMHRTFMPDVLQHGDTWINNILFERDNNGGLTDKVAAFIDWQLCLRGACVNDMTKLTAICVNQEMRRAHEYDVLQKYYDRLKSKAGDKLTASFDRIKILYDSHMALNSLLNAYMIDFILNIIVKSDEDLTGFRKRELLQRTKAGYDDAAIFYGWNRKPNEDLICDGPVTKREVELVLRDYFKSSATLNSTRGVVISKGVGFTSDVIRVDLDWTVSDGVPSKVIVKSPKVENLNSVMENSGTQDSSDDGRVTKMVQIIHECECKMYRLFDRRPPVPVPDVYGYRLVTNSKPGFIVMEDVGDNAGLVDNLATGFTLEQWRSCFECLADLHVWSLTTDVPWRDELTDDISESPKSYFLKSFQLSAREQIKKLKCTYSEYFSHVDEKKVYEAVHFDNIMETHKEYQKIMPEVIQHGDFHINNILFEKAKNGALTSKVCAIVDWQICTRGSAVGDMIMLSAWCVNHELRRAHERDVLKHYYDRLMSKLGEKLNVSFEQIEDLYKSSFALNGLTGLLMVEMILNTAARLHEDETGWRKKELLERWKACYDDAVAFYGW